jgi:hypothetical protein
LSEWPLSSLDVPGLTMSQTPHANPTSEHALFLVLFVTNAGGW